MFSGIVEALGQVTEIHPLEGHPREGQRFLLKGVRMAIQAPFDFREDIRPGHSMAVNGACLTVVAIHHIATQNSFWVDVSPETLEKTYFKELKVGDKVNLERPLKLSDRLHGHWVTGHIDGVGKVVAMEKQGEFLNFTVQLPQSLSADVVQKGSLAIEGVSLTVNECKGDKIQVMLIPETLQKTTLGQKKEGDFVQVELDLIGKYIKKWVKG